MSTSSEAVENENDKNNRKFVYKNNGILIKAKK